MNPTIKQEWVKRLRSGEYKQGKGYLCSKEDGNLEYCCLGVLCEIWWDEHRADDKKLFVVDGESLIWSVRISEGDARTTSISKAIQQWSGVNGSFGDLPDARSLADLNDRGVPFTEIANIIKREL